MRILYVCSDMGIPLLGRKGASVHLRSLAQALERAGHTVVLTGPVLTGSPWEPPADAGVELLHVPPGPETIAAIELVKEFNAALGVENALPGDLRRMLVAQELGPKLLRRFHRHRPDVVYERLSLFGTAGARLAAELDLPLMLEVNAPLAQEHATYRGGSLGALAADAERWVLQRADALLAVSAALAEHAASAGVARDRIHVVPNGVDAGLFRPGPRDPALRARLNLGEGPVLGFVGGLRPWHGVDVLPAVLERVRERRPDTMLVVVGEGQLRPQLESEIRDRGLDKSVVLTGSLPHEEVPAVIREMDVALAPYPRPDHDFYFSPLKLFEYMACGVPVVASDLGQIGEVVEPDVNGLLYPAGDVDALVEACLSLLADEKRARQMGAAAAEVVAGRFTWDANAAAVEDLARHLLRERGREV